ASEFAFECPTAWKVSEKGKRGKRDIQIRKGSMLITMDEGMAGSLVGNIAQAGNRGQEVSEEFTPIAQVHRMRKPKEVSAAYQEGQAVTVVTRGFGKARMSEFTEGSKRGFRATVLRHETALDIFCTCRASDFETLRPVFERLIKSLGQPF